LDFQKRGQMTAPYYAACWYPTAHRTATFLVAPNPELR
jgi:hypothetical protein